MSVNDAVTVGDADLRGAPVIQRVGGATTIPAGVLFALGGAATAWGSWLRWFAPGYDPSSRLDDAMSPLLPSNPELTVPGSVEATALGYLVLLAAWLLALGLPTTRRARWCLVVGVVCAAVTCAVFGGYTAAAALTGRGVQLGTAPLAGAWAPFSGAYALGGTWVTVSIALAASRRVVAWVAAACLFLTVPLTELVILYQFSPVAWDDPTGFGVLSGLAYVAFGVVLVVGGLAARVRRR